MEVSHRCRRIRVPQPTRQPGNVCEYDALDLAQERPARVGIGALPEAPARAAHPNTYPDLRDSALCARRKLIVGDMSATTSIRESFEC
jgi:hypothetical protein